MNHTECWTEIFGTLLKALEQIFFDAHDSLPLTFQYSNKIPLPFTLCSETNSYTDKRSHQATGLKCLLDIY